MLASAPFSGLLSRSRSMKGAPRPIHKKHGTKVHQVASSPPSVPASIGGSEPERREEPDELHNHDERPRGGLGHAEPIEHFAGPQPPISLDRLLRHISEHG